MINSRNVDDIIKLLKKELNKTLSQDYEKNSEYRQLLIKSIHTCAIKFVQVARSVVEMLLDILGEEEPSASSTSSTASAVDVISFVKEVVEIFPDLRSELVSKLISTLHNVRSGSVVRGALWIIGEYSLDESEIKSSWAFIRSSLGEIPILSSEQRLLREADDSSDSTTNGSAEHSDSKSKPKVNSDGTYATETAFSVSQEAHDEVKSNRPPLRSLILNGSWFVASVLASTVTKLTLRALEISQNAAFKMLSVLRPCLL